MFGVEWVGGMPKRPRGDVQLRRVPMQPGNTGSQGSMQLYTPIRIFLPSVFGLALALPSAAATVALAAVKDNTLYEDAAGGLSNGSGGHLFAGRSGEGRTLRGLLEFDVAAGVPAGATIVSATLTLNMSRTLNTSSEPVMLHRASAEWGEGASAAPMGEGFGAPAQTDDATWLHSFFPTTFWNAAGGDFAAAPSASTGVLAPGSYSWSSAQLAADVQSFLDDPAGNHGWLLKFANEANLAKRFDSRNHPNQNVRPVLAVEFENASAVPSVSVPGVLMLWLGLLYAATRLLRTGAR